MTTERTAMYVKRAPKLMHGLKLERVLSEREALDLLYTIRGGIVRDREVRRSKTHERPDGCSVIAAEADGAIFLVWLRGNVRNLLTADVLRAEKWTA